MNAAQIRAIRESRPTTPRHLWDWIKAYTGIELAWHSVCKDHSSPYSMVADAFLSPQPLTLWHGPRGGGKSFSASIVVHLRSRFNPRHGSRILGGSKDQSKQIYQALTETIRDGRGPLGGDGDVIKKLLAQQAKYINGSEVAILSASSKSVRGPHVPSLFLDEVDEIDEELRESALGMAMNKNGYNASVLMSSTWHRQAGPMAGLMSAAQAGEFPFKSFCIFEVLERCPESRSGKWVGMKVGYENCPSCPIRAWCHADRMDHRGLPKAKRSDGHYSIDALIQKARGVSPRVFEADYLCTQPKAAGVWFARFSDSPGGNVSILAEYDPKIPVILSIDSGVRTGAVWFQVRESADAFGPRIWITVFADFFNEGDPAFDNGKAIIRISESLCNGKMDFIYTDPAGKARTPVGPIVMNEYIRAGLTKIQAWPIHSVIDGLALLESFVRSADGSIGLLIHPRCKHLIDAMKNYKRKRIQGEFLDEPADSQHPYEDMVDPLRSGLIARFPDGRKPERKFRKVPRSQVF